MKKRIFLIAIAWIVILLAGCEERPHVEMTLEDVINHHDQIIIDDFREGDLDENIIFYNTSSNDFSFGEEEVEAFLKKGQEKKLYVTRKEALEDTDTLFKLLKRAYGGYGFYGGEGVFEKTHLNIIDELSSHELISTEDLAKLYIKHLDFISDGHFLVEGSHVNRKFDEVYFCNQNYNIIKIEEKYYLYDDKLYEILSINKIYDFEKYIKLSLDERGHFIYYFGILENSSIQEISLNVQMKDDKKEYHKEIFLKKVKPIDNKRQKAFSQRYINNIRVVELKKMQDRFNETTLRSFVKSGEEMKDESVLIIDIRGNRGESYIWTTLWFENFLGCVPSESIIEGRRFSEVHRSLIRNKQLNEVEVLLEKYNMPELEKEVNQFYKNSYDDVESSHKNYWVNEKINACKTEYDDYIIVLIDKHTASSAEHFLLQLKQLNNVVVIGSNTKGAMAVNNQIDLYLPNTKMNVIFGRGFDIYQSGFHQMEGHGIEPDIWLDNDNMLRRVIKMCEHENLNKINN